MTERDPHDAPLEDLLRAAMSARAEQVTLGALGAPQPPGTVTAGRSRLRTIGAPLAVLAAAAAAFGAVSLVEAPDTDTGAPAVLPSSIASAPVRPEPPKVEEIPPAQSPDPEQSSAATPSTGPPSTDPPVDAPPISRAPATNRPATNPPGAPPSSTRSTQSGKPPTTSPSTPSTGKVTDARAIKVSMISGWRENSEPVPAAKRAYQRCFGAADTARCDLDTVQLRVGDVDDPNAWPYAALDENPYMWASQPLCAKDGRFVAHTSTDGNVAKLVTKQQRTVAGRAAVYREVAMTCAQGRNFTVRVWTMSDLGIDILATSTGPEVDAGIDRVVAGMDLTGFAPTQYKQG